LRRCRSSVSSTGGPRKGDLEAWDFGCHEVGCQRDVLPWSACIGGVQPGRTTGTLAGQAEWQTRLLPAAAEQMAAETGRCEHALLRTGRPARIGAVS
jgi:hypothetical protein